MSLTLYCNSFAGKIPLHHQQNQKNIMCGSYYLEESYKNYLKEKNFILDDTQDNISHLNHLLGDLTGLYWVWKNTNHEFVGTNQYRRFFDDDQLNSLMPLKPNTIYVSEFVNTIYNCWDQYKFFHSDVGINLLKNAVNSGSIPIKIEMFNSLYHINLLSTCNTFFAEKSLFDKICELLFSIIFELYSGSKYIIEDIQSNMHFGRSPSEKRLLAFLAERILNIIYLNCNYFFGFVELVPVRYITKEGNPK